MLDFNDYCTIQRMMGQLEVVGCFIEKSSEPLACMIYDAIEVLDGIIDKHKPEERK